MEARASVGRGPKSAKDDGTSMGAPFLFAFSLKRMDIQLETITISQLPRLEARNITDNVLLPVVDELNVNRILRAGDLSKYTQVVGEVVEFTKNSRLPTGYLPLTGGTLRRTSYPALYNHLNNGLTFGQSLFGDSFSLPNLTHTNNNLQYTIYAGVALPPSPVTMPLSGLQTAFTGTATTIGGSLVCLSNVLSAFVTIPANAFTVPTSITVRTPTNSNSGLFFGLSSPAAATSFYSTTGSGDLGISNNNISSIKGMTPFTGINVISALPLTTHPTHTPFLIQNNATSTLLFTSRGLPGVDFGITVPVEAFEHTVSGQKYTLKSYLVTNEYAGYDFAELVAAQPITSPSLSSLLFTGSRDVSGTIIDLFNQESLSAGYLPFTNWFNDIYPLILDVPVLYNNRWGYIVNNLTLDDTLLSIVELFNGNVNAALSSSEFGPFLSFYVNPTVNSAWLSKMANVTLRRRNLFRSKLTQLTTLTSTDVNGQRLLKINVPITNNFINNVVTFYAR